MITNKMYKGTVHIHTELSDGTGNIKSIVSAAKKAGLDWIIITDHNIYNTEEGYYDGILVIKGEEISPECENHYIALGINKQIEPSTPGEYVNQVRLNGGFGFMAHPDEGTYASNKKRANKYRPISWTANEVLPDGIEIWNWFSTWADNLSDKNIFHLIYAYLFKHELVKYPNPLTIKRWDEYNRNSDKIVPAIGGADAHALKIKKYIIPLTIFPYSVHFSTILNIVNLKDSLSENFKTAKQQILTALKYGNNMIINTHVSKIIPDINAVNSNGIFKSGQRCILDDNTFLNIKCSKKYTAKIFHDGNLIYSAEEKSHSIKLSDIGKYRTELWCNDKAFIFTNPILAEGN